jgi:PAS domain S-box-containing protein
MEEKNWEKLLLTYTTDIAMVLNKEGNILYINHVLPGFTLEKVIGSSVNNYIPPGYVEAYKEALKEVFTNSGTKEFVVTGAGTNNTTAWYLTRMSPIKEGDQVIGASLMTTDITQRMLVDEDLKTAKKEVDRLQNLLNQQSQK